LVYLALFIRFENRLLNTIIRGKVISENLNFQLTMHQLILQRFKYWNESLLRGQLPKPRKNRYLVFDVDEGGLNNIRLALEYVVILAALTGRTLVLPAKSAWYLINYGPMPESEKGGTTEFGDIYNIDALANALPVINTEQFIGKAAKHLNIPDEFACEPAAVNESTKQNKAWRNWLLENAEIPAWNPYDTVICMPDIESAQAGWHMSGDYLDSRTPVEFSAWMNAAPVLYFPSTKQYRSLGPVATMLADRDDSLPRLSRRLIKHHIRYRDEIFSISNDIIEALGLDSFDALQIRRNDFQYDRTRVSVDKIIHNIRILFDQRLPIYIATDEDREGVFDDLAAGLGAARIFTWKDVEANINKSIPYAWIGPIEQLICTQARRFVGNDLSTFTSYIHRLRGYGLVKDKGIYFHSHAYESLPDAIPQSYYKGRTYLRENPLSWQSC